jgi:8-oxo-dGTP pyrophosphatase MutT (NUDIX family)
VKHDTNRVEIYAAEPVEAFAGRLQYAALPWKLDEDLRILLVTSRETGRWVIPKGWPQKGRKPHQAAAREAVEEAGVSGKIAKSPIGVYTYPKTVAGGPAIPCLVEVFPMQVERQRKHWPEQHERTTRWFAASEASSLVQEPELQALMSAFAAGFTDKAA